MRRTVALAGRLAAISSRTATPVAGAIVGQAGATADRRTGTAAAALAAAGLAAACLQPGLAEAPQHQPQQAGGADCPDCSSDVQLEDQPSAVSNSATAQWRVFTDMGRELVHQGRHAEAERYFKKAVDMARQGFGEEDPHMASACNNLAEFYRLRRRYDEAEPLYLRAVSILGAAYGQHDARVAFALHNLGGFYLATRRLDRAADCYERALRMKLEVLGTGHSETSNTMAHLGEVRWRQGQRDAAVKLLESSLEIMEAQGVGATPGCVRRRGRLAEMLLEAGRVQDAERLLRGILAYVESSQGLEHGNLAAAAENLAAALQRQGRWDEARALMHRALEARSAHAGARHPVVAVTLRKLAELELGAAEAREAGAGTAGGGGGAAAAAQEAGTGTAGGCGAAAAAAQEAGAGTAGGGGAAAAAADEEGGAGLAARGRQQAVAIAREAAAIAAQAQAESLDWQRRQGLPEQGGGLLAWLRPARPQLSAFRRPQRPDAAALESAQCLLTLGRARSAAEGPAAAAEELERALAVLAEAFPPSHQPDGAEAGGDGDGDGAEGGGEGEEDAGGVAAAIGAREQARATRVEGARHELACCLLRELLAQGVAGDGGGVDAAGVRRRLAEEGCG